MINHHLTSLAVALQDVDAETPRLQSWGIQTASVLLGGGRLLACGTGGSVAQAQHLVAKLVRREGDRPSLPAFVLPSRPVPRSAYRRLDGMPLALQVRDLGRPGDILFCVCATRTGHDLKAAVRAASDLGLTTWALTGPRPNPVADACTAAVGVPAAAVSTAEEVHLAAIHIFCSAVDSGARDGLRERRAGTLFEATQARP